MPQDVVIRIRLDKTRAVASARELPGQIAAALKGLQGSFGKALLPGLAGDVEQETKKVTRSVTASMDAQKKAQFDLHKISAAEYGFCSRNGLQDTVKPRQS